MTSDDLLDALRAVLEAIDIPNGATMGDQEIRDRILIERVRHTKILLTSILGEDSVRDIPWSVSYLREQLAKHPAVGYRTWEEAMAELKQKQAQVLSFR
jgi:hypothetical protein